MSSQAMQREEDLDSPVLEEKEDVLGDGSAVNQVRTSRFVSGNQLYQEI